MGLAHTPSAPASRLIADWLLRLATAAALAIDAYVHADLAGMYANNRGHGISQGQLFMVEAGVSALAALLVLSGRRAAWAFAFLVSASALGAVLLYRYVDVGALGPLPNMYEPLWYSEKKLTAIAEAAGTGLAALGLVLTFVPSRARKVRTAQHVG